MSLISDLNAKDKELQETLEERKREEEDRGDR